jgi:hypothetical protein
VDVDAGNLVLVSEAPADQHRGHILGLPRGQLDPMTRPACRSARRTRGRRWTPPDVFPMPESVLAAYR